jgi:hypothetical protein
MRHHAPEGDIASSKLEAIDSLLSDSNLRFQKEDSAGVEQASGIKNHGDKRPPELNGLSPEAIDALIDAASSLFTVDVLEKDGKTLVLLGESHVKPSLAARSGEQVLQNFPLRVLEGATMPGEQEPDTTDAAGPAEDGPKASRGGIWGAYFHFLQNVKEITGGFLEGSTITLAASQSGKDEQGREIVNKRMEAGHVPSAREIATFDAIPLYLAAATSIELAYKAADHLPPDAASAVQLARALINIQSTLTYIDTFSGGRLSDHALGHLVNPMSGILHGRSETMAKNIGKVVAEEGTKKTPTLAILGAAHVHKVMQDLSNKQGFKRVFLPGQHSGLSILDDMTRKAQNDIRLIEKITKDRGFNKKSDE